MTNGLTFRALGALPVELQSLARAHVAAHPSDDLGDLVFEIALAALELAGRGTDAQSIFSRARSRLRRITQDPAHFSVMLDEHHDIPQDGEPTPTRRVDIVREVAARQRVTARRAQQIIRAQLARSAQGDLFIAEGGAVCQ
jgi:hypothetical protein